MALRDNINKVYEDQKKLRNAAPSQGISPLTELTANNNRNADSLKMAGTQQAQQGAMNQLTKNLQAGALAQQQELAAQQRYLQDQQFQPQTGVKSIEDFQSEAIEKAQENVSAQAQELNQKFAPYGSLGSRIGNAVMEEMAKGGEVAAQFERDDAILTEAAEALAADGVDIQRVKDIITQVLDNIEGGNVDAAIDLLVRFSEKDAEEQLFNTDSGDTMTTLTNIFNTLKIDAKSQQDMITGAIVDGVVNPDEMTIGFALDNDFIDETDLGMGIINLNNEFGADWKNMTISQFTEAVEKLYEKDTKDRARILKQLEDPTTDASIKRELRRELQMLDASGVTSAYEAAGRSVKRAQQIDKIAIGGELKNIDEVLDDENIKNRTDELLLQLQNNPDKVQSILAEWKEDNPGYEDMGDWILEQQQEVLVKGETLTDTTGLVKQRDEEASDTIQNNELFQSEDGKAPPLTDAHMAVLAEFGLVTNMGDFGKYNNQEIMDSNVIYQALLDKKNDNYGKFEKFMDTLVQGIGEFTFEKKHLEGLNGTETKQEIERLQELLKTATGNNKVHLQKQLDAANEKLLVDFELIYETLSDKRKAEKFAHIAQMNEELASMEFNDSGEDAYNDLLTLAFGDGHPLQNATKDSIQGYLNNIGNFVLVSDKDRKFYNNLRKLEKTDPVSFYQRTRPQMKITRSRWGFPRITWRLSKEGKRFAKIKDNLKKERLFGFDKKELENMKNLQAIFDTNRDGKIDSPATIKATLMKDGMFADGINLKDIGSYQYNRLNSLLTNSYNNYDTLIQKHITEAIDTWDKTYKKPAEKAATVNQKIDENEPWINDPNQMGYHPKIAWLAASGRSGLGPGSRNAKKSSKSEARNQTRNILKALYKNPNIFKNYFNKSPRPKWDTWFHRNIGVGNRRGNWGRQAWAFRKRMREIGGYNRGVKGPAAFLAGIEQIFGPILKDLNTRKKTYRNNSNLIRQADKGNPYSDLLG